jgi:flavin reductase (DIM6/NTAB) family NADH-FMN oxidoreductase RutF
MKKRLPLSRVYRLLEPGPVVLLTTAGKVRPNVMTMSWHTMMDFEPPLVGCVVSNRNYSFELLTASRECVINIPTVEIAKEVVACGNSSGRRTDKLKALKLATTAGSSVGAPLIDACYANLECRLADTRLVRSHNFFVLEVLQAWIDPDVKQARTLHHRGRGVFMVAGDTIRLRSKMK